MDTKPYEQQIDEIMDNFDFGRVHKAMTALDWTWNMENGVPDEATLRKFARELLRYVVNNNLPYVDCGGFEVSHENGYLELRFVVEGWHGDDA